jgi:flagellar hook-basal body complex protein FliE
VNTPITRVGNQGLAPSIPSAIPKTESGKLSFEETLKQFVTDVNDLQIKADELKDKWSTGELTDLHEATIAAQEASTAMELMVEIRNKIVEAYQTIMSMPV